MILFCNARQVKWYIFGIFPLAHCKKGAIHWPNIKVTDDLKIEIFGRVMQKTHPY